jgi:AcrR family transcriptional regulator
MPTGQPGALLHRSIDEHIDELAAEVATHRHGRVPADLRRAHIVAIAFGLFSERSFDEVSMDELARRAGVSKPVVYGLVGDKESVFRSCVELAAFALGERVRGAMRAETEAEACLRAGARAFFELVAEGGPGWDRLLAKQGGPATAELQTARRRQAEVVAELLGELFDRERPEGAPPHDRQLIQAIAYSMNGACESLAAWWRDHPEVPIDHLTELATRLVAPGVIGVIARPVEGWPTGEPTT